MGVMKKWILPIFVVLTLLFTGLGIYVTQAEKPVESTVQTVQPKPIDVPLNADKILELVNAERAKINVAPLVSDPRLVQSAQLKADDFAINNYFDHVNPTTGKHGYEYIPVGMCRNAGENIVWIKNPTPQEDNQEAVDWWMNSKPHHDAMLDPTKSLAGMAVNGKYIVLHLCEPK